MKSLFELYRIGVGPSSSHTMAPHKAASVFRSETPSADAYKVILYGSLAKTGKGHMTDKAVKQAFFPVPCEVVFDTETEDIPHPNTLDFYAFKQGEQLSHERAVSTGGGSYKILGRDDLVTKDVYPHKDFAEIKKYCDENSLRLWEYALAYEGDALTEYMTEVWHVMRRAIDLGLKNDGILDGGLEVRRRAKALYEQRHMDESAETRENRLVCSFAFAVSEQNASGGEIVTAPTCGACGVIPAVLRYNQLRRGVSDDEIVRALMSAGIIGNVIKTNASISGAECGCQAEIGSACSMAAAALAELYGMSLDQIEYAAEICIEHHLGLTCDPICGLVQIPCIERNAVAAMRAINAVSLANFLTYSRKISFDSVVATMYQTGKDLSHSYKETSESGLAKLYNFIEK